MLTRFNSTPSNQKWPLQRRLLFITLVISGVVLSVIALLYSFSATTGQLNLEVGDVAPQDILAPYSIEYDSEILTSEQQEEAAAAVASEYAPPNTSTARYQVGRLRATLTFIENVRQDEFASQEQQLADLAALQDIHLNQESALALLMLNENSWQTVQQESIVVLEQLMRSTIREDRLDEARRGVPALISLSVPEDQATLVAELVTAFVAPNSLYSETLTAEKRAEARAAVAPVSRAYATNQTIVRRGQVITAVHLEALDQLGLTTSETQWQEVMRAITFVLLNTALVVLFFYQRRDLMNSPREIILATIFFILALLIGRTIIPERTIIPYIFPSATFALVIAALFSSQAAMTFAIPLSLLTAYSLSNQLELTLYFLIPSLLGVMVLRRAEQLVGFFWAGATISGAAIAVVLTFRLGDPNTDLFGLLTLLGAAAFNGLGSASLALVLHFFIARLLGITTILELMELSRPDHPLLQFILRHAPGTYQHSLQIANLAEQAAEAIGADATLVRVGALYHDAGKARQPHFFIENQIPGSHNPHDDLDPLASSQVIIAHVTDGIEIADKHRLPQSIKNFIIEHHGTLVTMYQYGKAVKAAGDDASKVDAAQFRYPGPRPQSRETALVMLADGCEARARAERPENEAALRIMVKDVVDRRVGQGQLDDTMLTMQDIATIVDSFTATLRGVYHPRIKYPEVALPPVAAPPALADENDTDKSSQ